MVVPWQGYIHEPGEPFGSHPSYAKDSKMDGFLSFMFLIAIVVGFIRGLTDDRPSFWRGFGEGLAGRGEFRGGTYFFLHDRRTGLGIGTRIDDD